MKKKVYQLILFFAMHYINISNSRADYQYCEEAAIELAGNDYREACQKIDTPSKLICAVASLKSRLGILDGCTNVHTEEEATCAAASIEKKKIIDPSCKNMKELGSKCAVESIRRKENVSPFCLKVRNERQDRCLAAFFRSDPNFAKRTANYDGIAYYCLNLEEIKKQPPELNILSQKADKETHTATLAASVGTPQNPLMVRRSAKAAKKVSN